MTDTQSKQAVNTRVIFVEYIQNQRIRERSFDFRTHEGREDFVRFVSWTSRDRVNFRVWHAPSN